MLKYQREMNRKVDKLEIQLSTLTETVLKNGTSLEVMDASEEWGTKYGLPLSTPIAFFEFEAKLKADPELAQKLVIF